MKPVWGSNRSSQLCHLPLIIIHNYPWYIPPSTGITQPKSSIHLVNDREWAERRRAAAGWIWVWVQHLHTTTLLQVRYQLRPTRKKTHSGSTACVPGLWMGSDCLSQWEVTVKVTFRKWTTAERDGICTLHLTIKLKKERMWSNTLNIIFRLFLPQHRRELHKHKPNFYHLHV